MKRTLVFLLAFSVALIVIRDVSIAVTSYLQMQKAAEQSLDAAIIEASADADRQRGKIRVDQGLARQTISRTMQQNLKTDNQLNNTTLHNSSLQVSITYVGDIPRIEMEYRSHVDFVLPRLFGMDTVQLSVKKNTPYLAEFL